VIPEPHRGNSGLTSSYSRLKAWARAPHRDDCQRGNARPAGKAQANRTHWKHFDIAPQHLAHTLHAK